MVKNHIFREEESVIRVMINNEEACSNENLFNQV